MVYFVVTQSFLRVIAYDLNVKNGADNKPADIQCTYGRIVYVPVKTLMIPETQPCHFFSKLQSNKIHQISLVVLVVLRELFFFALLINMIKLGIST